MLAHTKLFQEVISVFAVTILPPAAVTTVS